MLGIDSSTNYIAWCLFWNRKPVKHGAIYLDGGSMTSRLAASRRAIDELIAELQPDFIAVEKVVFVNNKEVVIKLAKIFGTLESSAGLHGKLFAEVTPKQWQYYIGNDSWTTPQRAALRKKFPRKSKSWYANYIREQRKKYTIDFFNKRYGLSVVSDDEADAIGIAFYAYNELTRR